MSGGSSGKGTRGMGGLKSKNNALGKVIAQPADMREIIRHKASSDGTLMDVKKQEFEVKFYGYGSRTYSGYGSTKYKDEILEAKTDGKGNLTFDYAKPVSYDKNSKTNTTGYVKYEVAHGAENGKTFGIDWEKVNSISGQTYSLREEAKKHGLKWDGKTKRWVRK